MIISLLKSRRFLPLFLTQFLGAFNDNVFKNAVIFLITFDLFMDDEDGAKFLVTLGALLFILPFFIFSSIAGQLAESKEKSSLIRIIKFIEVILMFFAPLAFLTNSIILMMVMIFFISMQSSFFGPLKYSILPSHLTEKELVAGNGLINMASLLAILLGTITGGVFILSPNGVWVISIILVLMACFGFLASVFIPKAKASEPNLKITKNIFKETTNILRYTISHRAISAPSLAIGWFWFLGASFLTQLPIFVKQHLAYNQDVVVLFLVGFSVGISVGSLVCGKLLNNKVSLILTRWAAIGVAFFGIVFAILSSQIDVSGSHKHQNLSSDTATMMGAIDSVANIAKTEQMEKIEEMVKIKKTQNTDGLKDMAMFVSSGIMWMIFASQFLMSIFGGIFIVPLYSYIQSKVAKTHKARVIASLNVINSMFMVASAIFIAVMLSLGFSIINMFFLISVATGAIGIVFHYYQERYLIKGKNTSK